jgi:hypothetical protein
MNSRTQPAKNHEAKRMNSKTEPAKIKQANIIKEKVLGRGYTYDSTQGVLLMINIRHVVLTEKLHKSVSDRTKNITGNKKNPI